MPGKLRLVAIRHVHKSYLSALSQRGVQPSDASVGFIGETSSKFPLKLAGFEEKFP
jgi:hypothetical protein